LIKTTNTGQYSWGTTYGGNGATWFTDLIELPDSSLLIFGSTTDFNDTIDFNTHDVLIMKTTSTGNPIQFKYWDSEISNDVTHEIIKRSNGNYLLGIMLVQPPISWTFFGFKCV
jgi:hypothetical protein